MFVIRYCTESKIFHKISNLQSTGQQLVLQGDDSELDPVHMLPPYCASLKWPLVLVLVPPPQVTLQLPQLLQLLHAQFTV